MFQTNHRFPIRFFMALLLAALCLLFPLMALGSGNQADESAGIYEGEYDANGKRSGQGTWTYYNYLYVGDWKDDMPNGKGTLYTHNIAETEGLQSINKTIIKGTWVNGFAEGVVEGAILDGNRHFFAYLTEVKNGLTTVEELEVADANSSMARMSLPIGWLIGSVPPWNDVRPEPDLPTPLANDEYDAAAAEWNEQRRQEAEDATPPEALPDGAVYEGEYDANGKRSGQGTLAYHNYLYVGEWKNDKPNGQGTLYMYRDMGDSTVQKLITRGGWVDGRANGEAEVAFFDQENRLVITRTHHIEGGYVMEDQVVPSLNTTDTFHYSKSDFIGDYAIVPIASDSFPTSTAVGTPWALYEQYPDGTVAFEVRTLNNSGPSVSPGNLANRGGWGHDMAQLGDWIFFTIRKGELSSSLYKMKSDGSKLVKIYEQSNSYDPVGLGDGLRTIGDWLYVGASHRMQANDLALSEDSFGPIWGSIFDDYEYVSAAGGLVRKKLDGSEAIMLDTYAEDPRTGASRLTSYAIDPKILATYESGRLSGLFHVDEDWVYLRHSNDLGTFGPRQQDDIPKYVTQITRLKNDGSRQTETHRLVEGEGSHYQWSGVPQIAGDRLYYLVFHEDNLIVESCLRSIDLAFSEQPKMIFPRDLERHITDFHVTEDSIYYGLVDSQNGNGAIMRMNLDGRNQVVLADGFKTDASTLGNIRVRVSGNLHHILIAGDWMIFCEETTANKMTWYMMKLDGTNLHKVGEPFIPEDAPGTVDSTGKWRYEVLSDGSAKLLGAGSKLKFSGKLAIPATVDKIPVTAIGENAFYGYDAFTGVSIPKSVTEIGDYAFFWCKGLTSATIPEGVARIGEGAFQYCEKLKKLALPASLTSVSKEAFANCDALKLSVAKKNEVFEVADGVLIWK